MHELLFDNNYLICICFLTHGVPVVMSIKTDMERMRAADL